MVVFFTYIYYVYTMANYVGNKGGQGIKEQLFNFVPKSERYFSLFYGMGGFENLPEFKKVNWVISEKNQEMQLLAAASGHVTFADYRSLVERYDFTSGDFIFCDPPYLHSTRRNGRSYYKFEFDRVDHAEFLDYIRSCSGKVLITHPMCAIYDNYLKGWYKHEFRYMSRQGWFRDCIWTNFIPGFAELHTYNYLGQCRTERQQIKRRRANFVSRFNSLPFHQKMAIFKELNLSVWQSSN
jgi:site-specific DNA-adenine methylase